MSSFFAQIMEPGGGVMLLPFVRTVIACLLVLTTTAAAFGVARIHMIILTVLSTGLLFSLAFFEKEFKKMQGGSRVSNSDDDDRVPVKASSGKTD